MKLFGEEMIEFLKEFQNELIEKNIPLWGTCTKDVGDNERFYARCECGYESDDYYYSIDDAINCESEVCPECGDDLDFLPESYKYGENEFEKLSEYEFVFKDNEVRLFELDAEYNIIEDIEVFESFDFNREVYLTNVLCYSNHINEEKFSLDFLTADIVDSETFKKFMKKKNLFVIANCECGYEQSYDTFKEACSKHPTDKCPRCKNKSLDIIYSDNNIETVSQINSILKEMEFNNLSLSDKIEKLKEESNVLVDTNGSVIMLDSEGIPTITFDAFDETYEVKNITIDNDIIILEYDEGFEIQLISK